MELFYFLFFFILADVNHPGARNPFEEERNHKKAAEKLLIGVTPARLLLLHF